MISSDLNHTSVVYEKEKFLNLKNEIIDYNTKQKGRSFYYECKPTDEKGNWYKCVCVLYASFEGGKEKLKEKIKP
jgi:hypothetical protein